MYNPLPNSFSVRRPNQQDQSNQRFDEEKPFIDFLQTWFLSSYMINLIL